MVFLPAATAVAVAAGPGQGGRRLLQSKSEFDVVLKSAGGSK